MIYFDNASTSYPKPPEVTCHLSHIYDEPLGSYGRSRDTHTLELSTMVEELRDLLSTLIGAEGQGSHIVFTKNATEAINTVIRGLNGLRKEEVLISPLEHNAVMRPLDALEGTRVPWMFPFNPDGCINLEQSAQFLSKLKGIRLCVLNAMSNLNGVIQPIREVSALVKKYLPNCLILIDGAQALPYINVEAERSEIDFVAITGHKSLMGPVGTGALFIRDPKSIAPLIRGGNGFHSEQLSDTDHMPERFEAGTINLLGLSTWYIGMKERPQQPLIPQAEFYRFIQRIRGELTYKVLCADIVERQGPVFSLLPVTGSAERLSDELYYNYGIATRFGLHCAAIAHRTLGTLQTGATRISLSRYNTPDELDTLFEALTTLSKRH